MDNEAKQINGASTAKTIEWGSTVENYRVEAQPRRIPYISCNDAPRGREWKIKSPKSRGPDTSGGEFNTFLMLLP